MRAHPWLRDFPWKQLVERTLQPPYKPKARENFDVRSVKAEWKDDEEMIRRSALMLENEATQALFDGYYYNSEISLLSPVYPLLKKPREQSPQYTVDTSKNGY